MEAGKEIKAAFIEPMLLLRTEKLPEEADWLYEIKFDGYRTVAFKTVGKVQLRSRNDKEFTLRYPGITRALAALPDETVVDGEVVALDEAGKPSFNALQNYGSSQTPLLYYVFDVLVLAGKDVMGEPLAKRRELMKSGFCPRSLSRSGIHRSCRQVFQTLIQSVKAQRLEGLVAKRRDGQLRVRRTDGSRAKDARQSGTGIGDRRIHAVRGSTFDALIIGYYEEYEAHVRGPHPQRLHTRPRGRNLMKKLRPLEIPIARSRICPKREAGVGGRD